MGGAIFPPKFDCPHAAAVNTAKVLQTLLPGKDDDPDLLLHGNKPCCTCGGETPAVKPWLCITCGEIHCLQESHMDPHCESKQHPISLNIADRCFWCIECNSYVIHSSLLEVKRVLYKGPPQFTRKELVKGLKDKTYRKIAVLTGAGISVAAGIPDFRTPGTGLYSRLSDLGLPFAEAVFQLDFFRSNPFPFYEVARSFLVSPDDLLEEDDDITEKGLISTKKHVPHIQPVFAHHFIKKLHDREQLLLNFTQNIDGLELLANLPEEKLIQAHGHMRTAHCIDCQTEYSMSEFLKHLKKQRQERHRKEVFQCHKCVPAADNALQATVPDTSSSSDANVTSEAPTVTCDANETKVEYKGLIKPDIVFFGESLPESFRIHKDDMEHADLVIVMGTSLQVFPFASLISKAPANVPVVMINRENPGVDRDRFLFLPGDIEKVLQELMDEVNNTVAKVTDASKTLNTSVGKKVPTSSVPSKNVANKGMVTKTNNTSSLKVQSGKPRK